MSILCYLCVLMWLFTCQCWHVHVQIYLNVLCDTPRNNYHTITDDHVLQPATTYHNIRQFNTIYFPCACRCVYVCVSTCLHVLQCAYACISVPIHSSWCMCIPQRACTCITVHNTTYMYISQRICMYRIKQDPESQQSGSFFLSIFTPQSWTNFGSLVAAPYILFKDVAHGIWCSAHWKLYAIPPTLYIQKL